MSYPTLHLFLSQVCLEDLTRFPKQETDRGDQSHASPKEEGSGSPKPLPTSRATPEQTRN